MYFHDGNVEYSLPNFEGVGKFESNITSDWLNHLVKLIRSCVTSKFTF